MARQGSRNSTIVLGSALHDDFAAMALVLRRENLARSAAAETYKNVALKAFGVLEETADVAQLCTSDGDDYDC